MTAQIFDPRPCTLGEGPLWHPERKQLFWFDITEGKLLTAGSDGPSEWRFEEPVSAAGWIDEATLLIASATGLWRFDLASGARARLCPLEQSNSATRSNDGRADPWGGFWIGTMGRDGAPEAGAIYRYHQGALRTLFDRITIPNAICFAPDRSAAYFADTPTQHIMKVALDRNGWPAGKPRVFVDLAAEGLNPDGAVVDADGTLWVAQWGAARVAAYSREGVFQRALSLPAKQVTCPAFGGAELSTLYVTSAADGLPEDVLTGTPGQGATFVIEDVARGLPEPRVLI
ncbi:SMP-30/gluconolactonase/LRE family protein [Roseobacter weihaiensis]|uniref:SMP-30/gluconolactonase/LRE family protein n=1 Tax=Roseobacter weihaiensis TaxID=2763262 RepID=UPI001D0A19B8|nr:SMP-30/gluconolactonase/LRE family protein [Roseobacter sp. H9]